MRLRRESTDNSITNFKILKFSGTAMQNNCSRAFLQLVITMSASSAILYLLRKCETIIEADVTKTRDRDFLIWSLRGKNGMQPYKRWRGVNFSQFTPSGLLDA